MLIILIFHFIAFKYVIGLPQPLFAHGIPNTLLIALNQIISSSNYTFSTLQNLLLDTVPDSDFLSSINNNGSQTFIAPTDDAFQEFYSNSSRFSSNVSNDALRLLECKMIYSFLTNFFLNFARPFNTISISI